MDRKKWSLLVTLVIFYAAFHLTAGHAPLLAAEKAPASIEKTGSEKNAITAEQKRKLQDVFSRYSGLLESQMKQYSAEKVTLSQLINAEQFNEAAVRAQFAKAAEVGADVTVTNAKLRKELRTVLTNEQLNTMMNKNNEMAASNIDRMLLQLALPAKTK